MPRRMIVALSALAVAGLIVWLGRGDPSAPMEAPSAPPAAKAAASSNEALAMRGEAPLGASSKAGAKSWANKKLDPERVAKLRAALIAAENARQVEQEKARASNGTGVKEGPDQEPLPGSLSKEYIRSAVQEIQPLIRECYEHALEETPDLSGKLVTRFAIVGDPELGGVVDDSEILADQSTVHHPALDECVKETMYGIELPAPENGGRIEVHYPFVFNQAPEASPSAAR